MDKPAKLLFDHFETPIGLAQIVCDEEGNVRSFGWYDREDRWKRHVRAQYGDIPLVECADPAGASSAITAYMAGDIHVIDDMRVAFAGTAFQTTVWHALRTIPAGTTLSYGQLARQIGQPKAVRAVGLANGSNPVALIVPCHRVIGSDGSLTGYGGGIERKKWLLAHEAKYAGIGLFAEVSR